MPADQTISNEEKITATLKIGSSAGKPAVIDGKPVWTVVSGDSTVTPADDGLSAELIASDTPGDTTVVITADADVGEGVEEISDTILLHVQGARAKFLGIKFGSPEPKE